MKFHSFVPTSHRVQELQRLCTSKSWAALVTPSANATAARPGSALVFRKNVGPAPKAGGIGLGRTGVEVNNRII